jgi:hypothetical protein
VIEYLHPTGARPTHEGAESIITGLCGAVDAYSAGVRRVYEPLWGELETSDVQPATHNEPALVE